MPSLKRASESRDSEDTNNSDSEGATSVSPSHSRKRPRPSPSPSEEDEDINGREDTPLTDEALLDEGVLELHQTQILQDKYAQAIDETNVPAEHGILEQVDCYNFMCHDHFSVELGPLINFIVGKNGSGKSAILTALTLCLGGKASDTNRGQSLKSFIKQGKESSTIVVRIKNQGDAAYRQSEYGNSIIVERHFTKSGSTGFKIKSEAGRIVSTKKAELDAITDYFSLQIDNPMNVLSQDMARQFLSSSSPTEKYKFFVKGVQLEQLDQDYRVIEDFVDQMEEKARNQTQDIRILEHHRNVAKKKLEASDKHDNLRERVRNLRQQMAWAQVEEAEKERDSFAQEVTNGKDEVERAEAALSTFDTRLEEVEQEQEAAADHAMQADANTEAARQEKEVIQSEVDDKTRQFGAYQSEEREIKLVLKGANDDKDKLNRQIEAENQRLAEVSDGSFARKQKEHEEARQSAEDARKAYEDHLPGKGQLIDDRQQAQNEEAAARRQVEDKNEEVRHAEARLRQLKGDNGPRQNGFHAKMPRLLKAIQDERSFTTPPIGPVGNHVTLLKPKWSSIIETSLGNNLTGFIVSSKRDQGILRNIMERMQCVCPIFIGVGGQIDTSSHEPDSQYETIMRILEIDNPEVQRLLVLQNHIEQTLLIEDLDEATSALYDGPRLGRVKRCYCFHAKDRRRGVMLTYNRSGDPTQAPVSMYPGNPRMKSDAASQIRGQEEIIEELKGHLLDLKQELQAARNRLESCQEAVSEHEMREHELKVEMQEKEDESERLREALDESSNSEAGRFEVLQKGLADKEAELELHMGSLHDCQAAKDAMLQELKVIRRKMPAQNQKISELIEIARVAESERKQVENRKHDIIVEKNSAINAISRQKSEVEKLKDRWEQAAERVVEWTAKAGLVSDRVAVDEGETPTSLDIKLDRLSRDLNNYDAQLGAPREEIAAEAARTETKYQQALGQIEETTHLVEYFKETLQNRKRRWEIFRAHISSRAKAQFTYLLSERSFRGYLLLDHNSRRLDLQVEPDITKHDGSGRNTTTLSGGEKSFSQVCLLLALWEAMGSPIRCLDEFDVYMDHINRKMSIEMLLLAARRSIGRQFILITPGTRSDIKIGPDVRVKELSDPERGQTTLPFQRG